jgi:Holliday junction resolvase-like predicted endonuclease
MVNKSATRTPFDWKRNYLVVIAGLMALLYFTLGIGFAFTSSGLDPIQRWTFIIFLILFPISGVGLIAFLIIRHSRKLVVSEKDDQLVWQIMPPMKQRQKMNMEVVELAKSLQISSEQVNQLRTAFIIAEDLALRQIEFELKSPLVRNVSIRGAEFDAVHLDSEKFVCIEVTFVATDKLTQDKINVILKKVEHAQRAVLQFRPGSKVRLLLILVTQIDRDAEASLRSTLAAKFSHTPVDVDIRLFDFEKLQKAFAIE